jgi:hypothetical protein
MPIGRGIEGARQKYLEHVLTIAEQRQPFKRQPSGGKPKFL